MKVPFYPADILIPKTGLEKWSVIACDQYTSDPNYWEDVENTVGDAPSTLRITLPEIYLEKDDVEKRVEKINETMAGYLEKGIFNEYKNTYIYVERTLRSDTVRQGIIGAIDLVEYDFAPDSKALIRATEKTVTERIPPRVKIRKNAPLELPHVLLLSYDPEFTVLNIIKENKACLNFSLK